MQPLIRKKTCEGADRLCGVEVEFAGLEEDRVAWLLTETLGGHIADRGQKSVRVQDTEIGDVTVELDTALRKFDNYTLMDKALDAAREIVPVEIVSAPLDAAGLAVLARFCETLRDHGAIGSRAGVLLGFGIHLNPEITGPEDAFTFDTIRAYALLEAYLRQQENLDGMRRVLPFVDPWPNSFVTAIQDPATASMTALTRLYAAHVSSRNHGLDLLPLLSHFDPDGVAAHFRGTDNTSARPTFHFRLPDCRIDEADWSLSRPFAMWRLVEAVADDPDTLDALQTAWGKRASWAWGEEAWARRVAEILPEAHRSLF